MGRSRPHRGNRRRGRSGGTRRRARTLTGTLVISRPGAGCVETPEGAFELARHGQREAMNGDEVEVALVEQRGRQPRAVVRSVVTRAVETFLGRFAPAGPLGAVTPLDARIGHDFFVVPEDPSPGLLGVAEGDIVVARITEYPTRRSAAVVTLERRLGSADELDLNVEAVVASYGLAGDFPASGEAQAEEIFARGEDDLYLIIGTDMLLSFDRVWHAADEIVQLCTLAVCARMQDDWAMLRRKAALLRRSMHAQIELVQGASIPISSTELRQGGALRRYTAPAVADYIEQHHLYGY